MPPEDNAREQQSAADSAGAGAEGELAVASTSRPASANGRDGKAAAAAEVTASQDRRAGASSGSSSSEEVVAQPTVATNESGSSDDDDSDASTGSSDEDASDEEGNEPGSTVSNGFASDRRRKSKAPAEHARSTSSASSAISDSGSDGGSELEDEDEGEKARSGTEEDEDGSDGLEEEPTLKYERLAGAVPDILQRSSATAIAVSRKYIALGTEAGVLFLLDHDGAELRRFRLHTATINDISIDTSEEFIATSSLDGVVQVQSLGEAQELNSFNMRRPMHCVVLEPNFGRRNNRQLVSGGMAGVLTIHEKGWLGNKETKIHEGEGPIWAVAWRGNLIAWANDMGVRVYDTIAQQLISHIGRSAHSPRADLYRCSLHWENDSTLLIGWANQITVASVRRREARRGFTAAVEQYLKVTAILEVDCTISGIVPHEQNHLILAHTLEDDVTDEATDDRERQRRQRANPAELRIISGKGEELSADELVVKSFERFQSRDYHLACGAQEGIFYVLSPQTIVVAQPRDDRDHVQWLLERQRYDEALHTIESKKLDGFDPAAIGLEYLYHLAEQGRFKYAAQKCAKYLGGDTKKWEDWVFFFGERDQLPALIGVIPTKTPQLSRVTYEFVLAHYLRHDIQTFVKTVHAWPPHIYDVGAVVRAVEGQLQRQSDSTDLMRALSDLYVINQQPGKALPYYFKLRRPGTFSLIRRNNLTVELQDQVVDLVEFEQATACYGEQSEAITLLVDNTQSIPIPRVIDQLQHHQYHLFRYLDALFDRAPDLAADYGDLQVELYAEFRQEKLLEFLVASTFYSLEKALSVCEGRDLIPEMIYLLGRIGDNKRALHLIIERLDDFSRAMEFAKEQNDRELWEDLLDYSESRPKFMRGLLENVGTHIDPLLLIRRIRNGMEIPGLKPALIKILSGYNLSVSLMQGCKAIMYSDCRDLSKTLQTGQTAGFLWTPATLDSKTGEPVFPSLGTSLPEDPTNAVHFLCGDSYDVNSLIGRHELKSQSKTLTTDALLRDIVPPASDEQQEQQEAREERLLEGRHAVLRQAISKSKGKACLRCGFG